MFCLVQFTEKDGGTISVVNNRWVTPQKQQVYWPPVKGTKAFDRLLAHHVSPDVDKWKLYGINKIFYETNNIDKAKEKLKLLEETSDLQTESDEVGCHKRKLKRNSRYITSSDDDVIDDEHCRPPTLKKKFMNKIFPSTSTQNVLENTNFNLDDIHNMGTFSNSPLEDAQVTDRVEDITHKICTPLPTLSNSFLEDLVQEADVSKSILQLEDTTYNTKLTGYQSKVLSLLSVIKTQNEEIIDILKEKNKAGASLKPDFKFPANTTEELMDIEIKLKIKDNYNNLVSYLKVLGGKDTSSRVFRIMKFLLTDKLSENFNFYGKRSNKLPFCELRLRDCVVEGVVTSTSGSTEKEVEDFIKVWLKHAPERVKKVAKNRTRLHCSLPQACSRETEESRKN